MPDADVTYRDPSEEAHKTEAEARAVGFSVAGRPKAVSRVMDVASDVRECRRTMRNLLGPSLLVGVAILIATPACMSKSTRVPFEAEEQEQPTEPDTPAPKDTPSTSSTEEETPKPSQVDAGSGATSDDCKKSSPSNVCDVVPQCGCPPAQTCDVGDLNGTTKCVTAGKAPMGQPCTATAGCALGLTCIGGTCHAFCNNPGSPCTQAGTGVCTQIKDQNDKAIPNLAICRLACAPHDPMSCGGKTAAGIGVCFVDDNGETDCQRGGSGAEHDACNHDDKCGPGLVCITTTPAAGGAPTSSCRRWCRVGQNDCTGGKTCVGLKAEVKVGNVVYGACP